MIKITIVTITYNLIKKGRKDWFIQNLESVHNQTYENIEHIVIDGASDDGSIDLLDKYQEKGYIKYWSAPDTGIYDAMNRGISHATGDYIIYLNNDDFLHDKHSIAVVADALNKSNADFLSGDALIVNEDGSKCCVHKTIHEDFFFGMPFSHQSLFVKKDVMEKLGGFDTNFKSAGDHDLIIRLFLAKMNGIEIRNKIVAFRLGGFSNTQKQLNQEESIFAMNKNFAQFSDNSVNFSDMYFKHLVPNHFLKALKEHVRPELARKLEKTWKKAKNCGNKTKIMPFRAMNDYLQEWKIFNLIPVLRIAKQNDNIKISVFGVNLFLLRHDLNKTICRLCGLPIWTYHK